MIDNIGTPLAPNHPGREAERLRTILETLLATQPELPLGDAVPMIFRIEEHAAKREREEFTALHEKLTQASKPIPTVFRDGEAVADWISSSNPMAAPVRDFMVAGKKINAIKEVRAVLGIGLKEAKDGVECWERRLKF